MPDITAVQFANRFASLVLKGNGLPRKTLDRHILLVSAVQGLAADREYSEPELNDILKVWSSNFGDGVCLDHVTLRRLLVDEKYLVRDNAGKAYRVKKEGLPFAIDPAIWPMDLAAIITDARKEQEERKRQQQKESER